MAAYKSVSQVKLNIQEILNNLEILENSDCVEPKLHALKISVEELLTNLENSPLESLNAKFQKRKKRRKYKKLRKLEKSKMERTKIENLECKKLLLANSLIGSRKSETTSDQIKAIKECQRYLKTFELLQQLHLVRGENPSDTYKFSLKLRQLRLIWNSLLQDKLQEQTSDDTKVQEQWNEILFGPLEKIYFREKPNMQDFIRKRQIWDSYIDYRYGSSIPIGWVIPPSQVNDKWRTYMELTHITN